MRIHTGKIPYLLWEMHYIFLNIVPGYCSYTSIFEESHLFYKKKSIVNNQIRINQIKVRKYSPQRCDNKSWFWKTVQISCNFYYFSPTTFQIICIKTEVLDHLQKHEKYFLLPVQTDTEECIAFSFLWHFLRWSHHPLKKKLYFLNFKTEIFHWMGFSQELCLL